MAAIRAAAWDTEDPRRLADLATQASRKILLVAASYASALRGAWTTDRETGAAWLAEDRPDLAPALQRATSTIVEEAAFDPEDLHRLLDETGQIVAGFEAEVGAPIEH